MPKISQQTSSTYGVQNTNQSLTFRERLMERFQPHEYVRVKNIDNVPIKWQYLPSHAEEHTYTADPMKITHRGEVEVYLLNPGESEVVLGENAYIFLDVLYKQLKASRVIAKQPNMEPGQARNFNFTDPLDQENFIEEAYIGKETPNFNSYEVAETPEAEEKVTKNEPKPKSTVERELKKHLAEQTS